MDNSIIITPFELRNNSQIYMNLYIDKKDEKLIRGTIKYEDGFLTKNAVVLLYVTYKNNENQIKKERISYTLTNELGEFAFIVDISKYNNCSYTIEAFNPITSPKNFCHNM